MDIIFKLSLPKEVCSKIFMYACKSPHHNTLGSVAIKHIIRFELYDKVIMLNDPYPNAFIRCKNGDKLFITKTHYNDSTR